MRSFECLGACDIAPMASVNGEYVGPLEPTTPTGSSRTCALAARCSSHKQLRYRRCVDPSVAEGASDFSPPPGSVPRADTAGLGPEGDTVDRPGPTAPIEEPATRRQTTNGPEASCFDGIDEPGLNTLPVYTASRRLRDAAQGARRWRPRTCSRTSADSGIAGPWRRRLPDGPEGVVPAPRRHGQVPGLQRRRIRARDVQGPRADAEEPPHADRGDRDHQLGGRTSTGPSSTSAASTPIRRTSSRQRSPRPQDAGLLGRADPRLAALANARASPRRGRVHLRRGDRAARLARGQARQPAAEAAVPRDRGPLPRPDADQQRRDALHGPEHHPA